MAYQPEAPGPALALRAGIEWFCPMLRLRSQRGAHMISDPVREIPSGAERLPEQPSELFHILEAYMAELEQGGQPQVEALLAKYPEHADALRAYCEKLTMLRQAAF